MVRCIGAVTVTVLYLKFFYFLRIFDNTAPLIRMIIEIVLSIRYFLLVYVIAVVGFGNGIYILSQNNTSENRFSGNFV